MGNDKYISCPYCNTPMKQKNLKKHLKNKCKIYNTLIAQLKKISSTKKEEEIDMSEMKDFTRLEELYTSLVLNENKFSLIESPKYKNNIKSLESYFLEKEILSIKNKVNEKLGKKEKKEYICNHNSCKKKFKSKNALKQHIKDVHKRKDINQNSTVRIPNSHNMSFLKDEEIYCNYCKKYYSKSSYSNHLDSCLNKFQKAHNNEKLIVDNLKVNKEEKSVSLEVKCQYCNKLIHKDYVDKHHKICSEINCEYCGEKLKKDNYQQHLKKCIEHKEFIWETSSSIKEEATTLTNIEKHQALKYQFREDEELDPDLIDEEAYLKTFGIELDEKNKQLRARVAFEYEKIYKQEEEDKSEIKIFLSKMYKGYCQVCGYTFKKTNGINSFERFNWNDKRVVKVKKSLVSTADSLCLCRNCSANIKWGAFYPNFIDTIREIEKFRDKSYDEIKDKIHKVVDDNIPKIFEPHLEFDDIYALEIELDGKPRNIYFTNEHLLQFITYLQKEDEIEEEIKVKKKRKREKDAINSIYSANSWLKREETIPLDLAESFIRATANWNHPIAHRYVPAPNHADNIYEDSQHGWALDFGSNSFLVGKAIERCKNSINEYIENQQDRNLTELKESLSKHISGAVATGNNYEYSGYYPIEDGYMKFGVQGIDVEDGVDFLIRELGLNKLLNI